VLEGRLSVIEIRRLDWLMFMKITFEHIFHTGSELLELIGEVADSWLRHLMAE